MKILNAGLKLNSLLGIKCTKVNHEQKNANKSLL